ncbi:hypothetical protein [Ferruginibacter sp. HRS2-29]|uniref:hypothetical protein n=1 Tax=Ferruginibacter sp. HRS2-29 TaxID=2487334 RepID=UPI0020CD8047|nr:hypothetical protein [Ferruginibacter sp. HRS2-29]MCP9752084.1 hypothetical protein [Ferruginibacter sp. HRS2-29]
MIAYNKEWLDNQAANDDIDEAYEMYLISAEEKKQACPLFPVGFYSPNYFIRVGLFILTFIIAGFSFGLICLILMSAVESILSGLLIFFGGGAYAMLEFFVRQKNHYRSGVDDALMWIAGGCILFGIAIATDFNFNSMAFVVLILALYFAVRFADILMAGLAVIAFASLFFHNYTQFGNLAKETTPFVMMILAGMIYFVAKRNEKNIIFKHYTLCNMMVKIISLLLFYAAGNYFIVREASNAMFELDLQPGQTILYGWLFWILTFLVPLLYIGWGVKTKDPVLLRIGLLLVAAIVFTVRYYHAIWPVEIVMLFGGILLVLIAYLITRWLSKPKMGFTSEEIKGKFIMDKLNLEALVVTETFGHSPKPDTGFGGGSFGGGGASGGF